MNGAASMLYPDESYQIVGDCFEVHNRKGCGFLEPVYQECLEIELDYQKIPFVAQRELQLTYRGRILKQTYKPDFICYDRILVEIKAVDQLIAKHEAQVINYLNATGLELGILINFGTHPKLEYKRLALTKSGVAVRGSHES
jgi:GxxExxY protein